ncbi:MAG: VCBS repeat-containing protein [Acidobacteriota bacterium]|nr:VCBS repeat-containing protein [Acidobacteriota bacterium]
MSDAAGAQLRILQDFLEHPDTTELEGGSQLMDIGFESQNLRPTNLTEVFADDVLKVRRWDPVPGGPVSAPKYRGASGLLEALTQLRQVLKSGEGIRVKFKTIQVEESKSFFTTGVLFEASSRDASHAVQVNASWRCRWSYPASPASPADLESAPLLVAIELERYEEVSVHRPALFADKTESTLRHNASYQQQVLPGIGHWLGRVSRFSGMSLFGHHGLAVGDANGDGLEDIYVCEAGGLPNRLYMQNADGTATDVSAAAGVDWLESTASALFVDLDNDGDQDLVAATRRTLLVAENNGEAEFTLRARLPDVVASATSLAAADYDSDGDLDLYVCGYDGDPQNRGLPGPVPYHDADNGGANVLLENDGDLKFEDVTARVGLGQNNTRYSFAAAWEDYDNDGDPDLYVANDFGRNNLYRNDSGRFVDTAPEAGVEDVASGMSVSWGDPNRDGWMDVYVSNMFSSAGNRIAYQRTFSDATGSAASDLQRMARGNTLFSNNGSGSFRDVSESSGVTMARWAWASRFADLNNDGWQDLVVTNGYISNTDSGDL